MTACPSIRLSLAMWVVLAACRSEPAAPPERIGNVEPPARSWTAEVREGGRVTVRQLRGRPVHDAQLVVTIESISVSMSACSDGNGARLDAIQLDDVITATDQKTGAELATVRVEGSTKCPAPDARADQLLGEPPTRRAIDDAVDKLLRDLTE